MRIALLINSLAAGGAERVAVNLAERMARDGIEVFFVCLEKEEFYGLDPAINRITINKGTISDSGIAKFIRILSSAYSLKNIIHQNDIDIVQSHLFRANYVNILARLFGSKHKAQIINHVSVKSAYGTKMLGDFISLVMIKWLYPFADQIIYVSQAMKSEGMARHDHARVIYNPHDLCKIKSFAGESVEISDRYLLSVGRLVPSKRHKDVIDAYIELRESHPGLGLLIAGDGPLYHELSQYISLKNCGHDVRLLGNVENPFSYMARSVALILASESEGLPNVIIEALACGVPVVSTDCYTGPREILAPGTDYTDYLVDEIEYAEYGILVPVRNITLLSQALDELLKNSQMRLNYESLGLKRASQFELELVYNQYTDAISELTASSP